MCFGHTKKRQLNKLIEVKPFICFNVMGWNINKRSQICGRLFQQSRYFCYILTCMDNYIWQFLIFTGVGFTAEEWLKSKMFTILVKGYRHSIFNIFFLYWCLDCFERRINLNIIVKPDMCYKMLKTGQRVYVTS